MVEHVLQDDTNDKVGYHGDAPGDPVVVPAGSIAAFSSTVFHRSGANHTGHVRRIYVVQYSAERIRNQEGTDWRIFATPFIKDGKQVAEVPAV